MIAGFRHIDLLRRDVGRGAEGEVEFTTLMWFDNLDAVRTFVGDDFTISHVPPLARTVLSRFDDRAAHYDVVERRPQYRPGRNLKANSDWHAETAGSIGRSAGFVPLSVLAT